MKNNNEIRFFFTDIYGITTDLFWDCDCDTDYIHTKNDSVCLICKAEQECAPDSLKDEVIDYLCELLGFPTRFSP